jgi:protein gp37
MANLKTNIEWTDKSWNPTTGCTKVSPGCLQCYAETITKRFPNNYPNGFDICLYPERLDQPLSWKTPSKIFVNSMSDLFHGKIPLSFIQSVFQTIKKTPQHTYQILTKRPERLIELIPHLEFHENIWLGVSVENQSYVSRIDLLRQVPAKVKFISCEPLLGPLNLNLTNIDWVIAGGESGHRFRKVDKEWIVAIKNQCQEANVPFFFKQWGGVTSKANGNSLDGVKYLEFPSC